MAAKRVIKELDAYQKDPSPAVVSLQPVRDDDVLQLEATLMGPTGTAYEGTDSLPKDKLESLCPSSSSPLTLSAGGHWDLRISLPPQYPNLPPAIHFITPCCHPNVNFKTGEICLDLLKTSWTPAYGMVSSLEAVQQLMSAGGEPDSPLNIDLARLLRENDLVAAEGLVRFYTGLYAMRR